MISNSLQSDFSLFAFSAFAKEIGIPKALILYPKGTHSGKELQKVVNEINFPLKFLERRIKWANSAELYVGLLKKDVRKDIKDSDSSLSFEITARNAVFRLII